LTVKIDHKKFKVTSVIDSTANMV